MPHQLHPRHKKVEAAKMRIVQTILDVTKAEELTFAEVLCILAEESRSWAYAAMKEERENHQHE